MAGKALSAATSLAGGLLGGRGGKTSTVPTQRQGYQTLKDIGLFDKSGFVEEKLPQEFIDVHNAPRVARPMRKLRPGDLQGAFKPKALLELSQFFDERERNGEAQPSGQSSLSESDKIRQSELDMLIADRNLRKLTEQRYANRAPDAAHIFNFQKTATDDDMAALGALLRRNPLTEANKFGNYESNPFTELRELIVRVGE